MATESSPTPAPRRLPVARTTDGKVATLIFNGALEAQMVRPLEEQLADPRLRHAPRWELEMSELTRMDLACGYALLRAATTLPEPAELHILGARRAVRRTLHEVRLDTVATLEE
ncbi:STAS domain-containing protein [Streptomyces flavidovirens]|uniref:STAS domain-containing protein n=1 Tax=Streptomyces flavidovirens TaxID=67298 RepID=UPI00048F9A53|nr:STAS domain-containing protein [Streptomyces flavidovirens]